jgi:hypothetical protein
MPLSPAKVGFWRIALATFAVALVASQPERHSCGMNNILPTGTDVLCATGLAWRDDKFEYGSVIW